MERIGEMNETMKSAEQWTNPYGEPSPLRRWWDSRSYLQKRLLRFCGSMLVMVVCFPLYYMGLFGSVEGPLNPKNLGDRLAGLGVTQAHSMLLFLTFLIIALSWNWIYNLVSLMIGSRLSCARPNAGGGSCGAAVKRMRGKGEKAGKGSQQYLCERGHLRPDAHFHPVEKGVYSHTLWVTASVFCLIVFFLS
ncbi:MAG: hypothetical protein C4530_14910 [Desulfobacteraceae bacterium]|nr:MAG: hypothetical protein C4530_14910 [Desulfobacteraceae bacterium]